MSTRRAVLDLAAGAETGVERVLLAALALYDKRAEAADRRREARVEREAYMAREERESAMRRSEIRWHPVTALATTILGRIIAL